jgi:hypothetical protein
MAAEQMTLPAQPVEENTMDISDVTEAEASGSTVEEVERGRRRTPRKLMKKRKERNSWTSK